MISAKDKVVLIIAGDFVIQEHIKNILRKFSFITISSKNLKDTEKYILEFSPDVICADIGTISLWNINIYDFFKNTKRQNNNIKIVIIYSHVDKDFLFKCFKSGVDDCIKSPFSIYDLAAKIFKILSLVEFSESIDFHGLKLFKKERYLIVNTSKIFITQKEVLILHTFFTRNTEISPKEFSSILKCNIPAVRMCINRLQKKLEKNTGMKIIKCRYGVGYYIAI